MIWKKFADDEQANWHEESVCRRHFDQDLIILTSKPLIAQQPPTLESNCSAVSAKDNSPWAQPSHESNAPAIWNAVLAA
jgi:hypothetical protein